MSFFFFGILKFHKIRHCERSEAISRNSKIPCVIGGGSKAEGAISRNSKFILGNSRFHVIPQLDWGISVLGNFRRNFDGILDKIPKFPKRLALR